MELFKLDKNNLPETIKQFGKIVKGGRILDAKTKEPTLCRYTNKPLTMSNLGGVLPGSEIFISNTDAAYAGYIMEFLNEDGTKGNN